MSMKRKKAGSSSKSIEDVEEKARGGDEDMCLLELPELVIECILERLPPDGLCRMAGVCSSLRDRCISDRLWERHMKRKWDRIIGPAAHREWHWHLAQYTSTKHNWAGGNGRRAGLVKSLYRLWPVSLIKSNSQNRNACLPAGSVMSWYLALETGKFSFPAQVYNRENGHVGFILSCYDAELCYDPRTDTFQARYPPHGRRAAGAVENGVSWDRVRAPPVDTCSPHDLHISDCLNELRPGDHIEIQWRRNKDYPYGWWYGIVGHLESCDTTTTYGLCNCHQRDTVVLEFNQYTPGSRWRLTSINRNEHREEGNEEDGFYGGIRKLRTKDDISLWTRLWPAQVLE